MRRQGRRQAFSLRGTAGVWLLPEQSQEAIGLLLAALLEADGAAHQYFNLPQDWILIICAMDEYPLPGDKTKIISKPA